MHLVALWLTAGQDIAPSKGWWYTVRLASLEHRTVPDFPELSGIDSTPPANERSTPDDVPIVVVMHGLTGG